MSGARVLIVGSGGREHALAWSLARSPSVAEVWCAPGNGGTPGPVAVAPTDLDGQRRLARDRAADLVVIGPEAPLVAGLADALRADGIPTFGPGADVARLEGSKAWAKASMARWGVPTAASVTVTDPAEALHRLRAFDRPPVVKASGLAAGKGVLVPDSWADAEAAVRTVMVERAFGAAGDEVVLEERLEGTEVSVMAVCCGTTRHVLLPAQDHKRLGDGDDGPNTGGMGAFAPAATLDRPTLEAVAELAIDPVLAGLEAEGSPFVGVLYAGLMLTDDGPRVLEYNCRLGDPETQAVLPLLDSDLYEILAGAAGGRLDPTPPTWRDGAAVSVVLAAEGYPGTPRRGDPITGIAEAEAVGCHVFHAGTAPGPRTDGGRVLAVTGLGPDVVVAADVAYRGVAAVSFAGCRYRRDIGRPVQVAP
jgi:phosphoribosylamine---glycine ligase